MVGVTTGPRNLVEMPLLFLLLGQQDRPGSVPGMSDVTAIVVGTLLSLVVIYAIVSANLRKSRGRP